MQPSFYLEEHLVLPYCHESFVLLLTYCCKMGAAFTPLLLIIALLQLWLPGASGGKYDNSITLFSPEGELKQVTYADLAGQRGPALLVATSAAKDIVICTQCAAVDALVDRRAVDKVNKIDDNVFIAFAGLAGDGLALVRDARSFCINHKVAYGCAPAVSAVARHIGDVQHKATITGSERPYGLQTVVLGFDDSGPGAAAAPKVYLVKASGQVSQWRAVAIGKGCAGCMEQLEKRAGAGVLESSTRSVAALLREVLCEGGEQAGASDFYVLSRAQGTVVTRVRSEFNATDIANSTAI